MKCDAKDCDSEAEHFYNDHVGDNPFHKRCHLHRLDDPSLAFANIWTANRITKKEYLVGKIMEG